MMKVLTGFAWLKAWIKKLEVTNSKFKNEIQQTIYYYIILLKEVV